MQDGQLVDVLLAELLPNGLDFLLDDAVEQVALQGAQEHLDHVPGQVDLLHELAAVRLPLQLLLVLVQAQQALRDEMAGVLDLEYEAEDLHVLAQVDVGEVGLQDDGQLLELESDAVLQALQEDIDRFLLVHLCAPASLHLHPRHGRPAHLVELGLQAPQELVSVVKQGALAEVADIYAGVPAHAELQEAAEGLAVAVEEDLAHELHEVEELILVVDEEAVGLVGELDLLPDDVVDAKLQYCVGAHVDVLVLVMGEGLDFRGLRFRLRIGLGFGLRGVNFGVAGDRDGAVYFLEGGRRFWLFLVLGQSLLDAGLIDQWGCNCSRGLYCLYLGILCLFDYLLLTFYLLLLLLSLHHLDALLLGLLDQLLLLHDELGLLPELLVQQEPLLLLLLYQLVEPAPLLPLQDVLLDPLDLLYILQVHLVLPLLGVLNPLHQSLLQHVDFPNFLLLLLQLLLPDPVPVPPLYGLDHPPLPVEHLPPVVGVVLQLAGLHHDGDVLLGPANQVQLVRLVLYQLDPFAQVRKQVLQVLEVETQVGVVPVGNLDGLLEDDAVEGEGDGLEGGPQQLQRHLVALAGQAVVAAGQADNLPEHHRLRVQEAGVEVNVVLALGLYEGLVDE